MVDVRQAVPRFDLGEEPTGSLETYVRILARRKWLLAAVVFTVVVAAFLQVFTTTPLYVATVTLQIDPEESKVLPYEEFTESSSSFSARDYIWTQAEKLKTRSLASRVVERLRLAEEPGFTEPVRRGFLFDLFGTVTGALRGLFAGGDATSGAEDRSPEPYVSRLLGSLQVLPLRNTRLINVSVQSPDPELSARICNTLAEEYIDQHLEGKFEAATRATEFLQKQLTDLKIKVEESEENLLAYAQARNIVNLNEREPVNRKKLADLSDELTRAESELVTYTARYEAARNADPDALPELLENATIRELETRLAGLERDLAVATGRYGAEWPAVKELRLEIRQVSRQLAAEKQRAIGAATSEYRLAQARRNKLSALVAEQRKTVERLDQDSIQYKILQREVDSNQELYDGLLQRLKEAGVAAGLKSSNVRVADEAVVPRQVASPRKSRTLMMALVLGLFLGVGAVFLVETVDSTLKTTEDVTGLLGLPALGAIPSLAGKGNGKLGGLKSSFARPADPRPMLVFRGAEAMRGRCWEAYRSLRTSLLLSHSDKPPQVILVTSALPGEGKTTTAANMAVAMAQTGARTVIVDLDLRRPAMAETFGFSPDQGMSTFLSGNSDLASQIRETGLPNLYLVAAGPPAPNPPELLGSRRMTHALKLLREYFAYVVIDSPPALEISDAVVLAAGDVDGVILVARGGKTPRQALRKSSEHLRRVRAHILGVLLNEVDLHSSDYGYYGYGQSYHDGYQSLRDKNPRSGEGSGKAV